jgi:hypothetical protein
MHHLGVKIFEQSGAELQTDCAIKVFHRWIQKGGQPELLIDVADYAHVPAGPGVVLMGHEAAYSLDVADNRLGLLYQRKERSESDPQASLRAVYDSAVGACRRLEGEREFAGKLKFDEREFALIWNDRALYPNTDESWQRVRPEVDAFLDGLLGAGSYRLTRVGQDRRERLSVEVRRA